MKDRRFVITTVYRCIDCPFFCDSYTCWKVRGGQSVTEENDLLDRSNPHRRWHEVRKAVAGFCPLKKVDIEGVAASLGIVLDEDAVFKALASFVRRMEDQVKFVLENAITAVAPRCPHHGSVVHTQSGGRTYNKKCPDCGIPLIPRVNHADGLRVIDYCHPNSPLIDHRLVAQHNIDRVNEAMRSKREALGNSLSSGDSDQKIHIEGINITASFRNADLEYLHQARMRSFFRRTLLPALKAAVNRDLNANEKAVWEVIGDSQIHIDDISEQTCLKPYDVSVALVMLEFQGLVQQSAGKMFVRKSRNKETITK